MSRYNGEQVLVVPREAFEAVGAFNGVRLNPQDYLSAFLQPGVARYMDREQAEVAQINECLKRHLQILSSMQPQNWSTEGFKEPLSLGRATLELIMLWLIRMMSTLMSERH